MSQERRTTLVTGALLDPEDLRPAEEGFHRFGGGRAWLAIPVVAALAGFLAAFLRHRRS